MKNSSDSVGNRNRHLNKRHRHYIVFVHFLKYVVLKRQEYFEGSGPSKQLHKMPAFEFYHFNCSLVANISL